MPTTYFTSELICEGYITIGVEGNDTSVGNQGMMFGYAVEALRQEVNCVSCRTV